MFQNHSGISFRSHDAAPRPRHTSNRRQSYRQFTVNAPFKALKSRHAACDSQDVPTVTDEAVRAHLGAILASSGFANAERMSRFLQYTVEMKLRGEAGQIKEFLLGREVFDRG